MKKTLGYGYKLSSQTLTDAVSMFLPIPEQAYARKQDVLAAISQEKAMGRIPMNAKTKIFKVVVEVLDA
jgi:hypothetical protein